MRAFRELGAETKAFPWTLSCAHEEHRLGTTLGTLRPLFWAPEPSSAPPPKACEKRLLYTLGYSKTVTAWPLGSRILFRMSRDIRQANFVYVKSCKKHRRLSPQALNPVPHVCGHARPNSCYVQSFGKYFRLAPGALNPFPRVHEHAPINFRIL